ncbi:WXG100 family type VII secretion target [Paenibacillus sp. PAMC 26794]|uniref:WXG100 family type VII secretion target n=1 Tax=Paenibacillus sp. PAMC 26794 TaxID=1257080 RepID=UPI0002EBAA67|nr:WXG100 family type VII secretion target [Paenibacillus sp. PAMC 26794]
MSRIQVTPERLFQASREVERTRAQMGDTHEELVRLIRWMESMWSGMVRERFLERFEETQPRMIETLEHLTHIAKELRDIGVRFQQADEMSGAAVAGTIATMSIGLKAANSPDDKGYRMAYNSQWHMWLPVNEKGVTDQAALQAYEKDKGKLDKSSLSQGMGPVEPPDQDLIQLQIEALELRVNPFTGEPVTDSYAKMMIASLKWSQILGGIGLVVGSAKGSKGPYKGRGTSAALDKVKQTIRDAKVKREKSSKSIDGTGKTGIVWDDIKATQPNNPGTNIPKSFEINVNGERYWVNPNATKHMVEYSTRTLSHGQKLTEQQLIRSFQSAVKEAAAKGYKFNEPVIVGNWELIFSPSREAGQLPVIKHGLYIP